jgi:hypothetical protein
VCACTREDGSLTRSCFLAARSSSPPCRPVGATAPSPRHDRPCGDQHTEHDSTAHGAWVRGAAGWPFDARFPRNHGSLLAPAGRWRSFWQPCRENRTPVWSFRQCSGGPPGREDLAVSRINGRESAQTGLFRRYDPTVGYGDRAQVIQRSLRCQPLSGLFSLDVCGLVAFCPFPARRLYGNLMT